MIDGWKINRKLAVLTEARVGPGRLAICTIDLEADLATRPVARQFRASLLRYLQSEKFSPVDDVSADAVAALFQPGRRNRLGEIRGVIDGRNHASAAELDIVLPDALPSEG